MQQKSGGRPWADEIGDGRDGYGFDAAKPTRDVPEENPDDGINQNDYADLPDLSDLEKMIDWDDLDEHGDPSARWGRNRISSP